MTDDEATMSLLEHLEELRSRIIVIAVAIGVAAIAGFFLADPIIALLRAPLPDGVELIALTVGEQFGVHVQVALMVGVALAMPVILYEIWRFVTPGLTRSERRLVWPLLGAAIVLFAAGLALGYLLIPVAVNFLLDFSLEGVQPLLGVSDYVGFVTTFMIAFGLALEFPVVLYLLARLGILSYSFLAARRRWVVIIIVLFAIVITPGDILVGSLTLSVVMYGLFELTLQLIRLLRR
ncbi:MAG: twin-arginine translocase subunit TatC [Chloroflexota bacterium]|jgi:sec-independent protein translocase protein TatC|nr:twin-arginine translocase subunit TatC [Chloroflexota bacterium]